MNEFDRLFNQFFGKMGPDPMKDMYKLIERLNNGGDFSGMNPDEANLGTPTSIVEFEQDGVKLIKTTWKTPYGEIVRVETKENIEFTSEYFKENNIPTGEKYEKELTLEEKLENAIKDENYELCAELRDEIKKRDEEISKKDNKDEASENLDNKGIPEDDGWNF